MNRGRKNGRGWIIAILVGIAALTACSGAQPSAQQPVPALARAEVQQVEVLAPLVNNGSKLVALVRGTLPSGCYQAGDAVVAPGGGLIVVILPAVPQGSAGSDCGGPAAFERVVNLGGGFAPGSYTVSVNGVNTVFTVEGPAPDGEAASLQANPPAARQEVAAGEAPAGAAGEAPAGAASHQVVPVTSVETPVEVPAVAASEALAGTGQEVAGQEVAGQEVPGECEDKAAFFADVSVEDGTAFDPEEKFVKVWRIRNAGTCTWQDYRLVFDEGDRMAAPEPVRVPGPVAPGDTVDIELALSAPSKPGGYYSNWLLSTPGGKTFGLGMPAVGLLWTRIGVRVPVPEPLVGASCAWKQDGGIEAEILRLINKERTDRGLPALALNEKLSASARAHSADMACNFFEGHTGSDRSDWYARIDRQGVTYRDASENYFTASPEWVSAAGVVAWWMDSQVHRNNILNPRSKQVGVGYSYFAGSKMKGYYTLNFIEP